MTDPLAPMDSGAREQRVPGGHPVGLAICELEGRPRLSRSDEWTLGRWQLGVEKITAAALSRERIRLAFFALPGHKLPMRRDFDPEDYALVAKLRANPPNPWKWEIYCAGKRLPIEQSATYFESRGAAQQAGKKALSELLAKLSY